MDVWPQPVGRADHLGVMRPLHTVCKGVLALTDALEDVDFLREQSSFKADSIEIDFEISQLTASRHVGCSAASCSVERGELTVEDWVPCGRSRERSAEVRRTGSPVGGAERGQQRSGELASL